MCEATVSTNRTCFQCFDSVLPLGLSYCEGPLELGRVGLNNRLKAGGRKKTKDGPVNRVGRRVVVITDVVVVVADYFICSICYVSVIIYTSQPKQKMNSFKSK